MMIQRPLARALPMALATALVLAAGCKTDTPAAPPAKSVDTARTAEPAKPTPTPEVKPAPPPPSLPADQASGDGSGSSWRDRRGARLDTDGDGTVSDDERTAAMHQRAEMMHRRLDADGDGKLTPTELEGARGRMRFDDPGALDTNHDGEISADELAAGMKARNERRRAARAAGSAGSGSP